ncbi:MAG: hypothetical protein J6N18_02460 [Kiritimatiellae bacterium]|nr:hypothetical protein [Kiritimatiellia bacterium]
MKSTRREFLGLGAVTFASRLFGGILGSKRKKWYKGNLHAHTLVSDGRAFPVEAALLYRDIGYDFLMFSEHNLVHDKEMWVTEKTHKEIAGERPTYGNHSFVAVAAKELSPSAIVAAIDFGARKVIVDWRDEGDWVVSSVVLRKSNQEIAIADGVTIRGKADSTANALLTIPQGVTNVFLYGIVTAAVAMENGNSRPAIQILGGENVTVRDLTVVSDGCDGIESSGAVKNLQIDSITCKKPQDWPKRKSCR